MNTSKNTLSTRQNFLQLFSNERIPAEHNKFTSSSFHVPAEHNKFTLDHYFFIQKTKKDLKKKLEKKLKKTQKTMIKKIERNEK